MARAEATTQTQIRTHTEAQSLMPGSADNGKITYQPFRVKGEEHER